MYADVTDWMHRNFLGIRRKRLDISLISVLENDTAYGLLMENLQR